MEVLQWHFVQQNPPLKFDSHIKTLEVLHFRALAGIAKSRDILIPAVGTNAATEHFVRIGT